MRVTAIVLLLSIAAGHANAAVCGNGIQEPGEDCDKNPMGTFDDCCDATTCTYKAAGTTCRPAHMYGNCDPGGQCSGTYSYCGTLPVAPGKCTGGPCCDNNTCDLMPSGTSCNPCGDTCDGANEYCGAWDKCSGGGCCDATCHVMSPGTLCRPAAGICDVAEVCTGGWDCPEDVGGPGGVVCRASASSCDPVEACNGSPVCGVDVNQCRATGTGPFAYLPNLGDSTVGVIDIATRTFWASIPVGRLSDGAVGIAVSRNGSRVYVGTRGGVWVIDTTSNKAVGAAISGRNSFSAAVTPDGQKVYVTNPEDKAVTVLNANNNTVAATIPLPGAPQPVGIALAGGKAYVGTFGPGVAVIDTSTDSLVKTIPLAATVFAGDVVALPDGSKLYVSDPNNGTVLVIDPVTDTVTKTISTGAFASALAATPNGAEVYVTNAGAGTLSVISTATDTVLTSVVVAGPSSGNGDGPPMGPSGVEITGDGREAWVVISGANDVAVIDGATHVLIPSKGFHVGTQAFVLGNFMQSTAATQIPPATAVPAPPTPLPDRDGDGVADGVDNCPAVFNPAQQDSNGNGVGDLCEDAVSAALTLGRVHVKAAPRGSIAITATVDATDWGSLSIALTRGVTIGVIGLGLPVPEVLSFPGVRCLQLSASRITCQGSRGETARFTKQRRGNMYSLKVNADDRTFLPPLTAAGVQVVFAAGGLDRRDTISSCQIPRRAKSATCRRAG